MIMQHQQLADGHWNGFSLMEQLANIGSEVERAIKWENKKNQSYSELAYFRALELIDLTLDDKKNLHRLHEIVRIRELLVDYFVGSNSYQSSDEKWQKYFYPFYYAARLHNSPR